MCSFRQGPTPSAAIATTGPSSWSMRIWSYNCVTRASPSRQSRSSWSAQIQPGSRRRSPHNAPNSYVSRTPCADSFSPWIASAPH